MRLFYDTKSNLYNVFILKCVSVISISIEQYMEGVTGQWQKTKQAEKEKTNIFWKFYWAVFQFSTRKYYAWQMGGLHWKKH